MALTESSGRKNETAKWVAIVAGSAVVAGCVYYAYRFISSIEIDDEKVTKRRPAKKVDNPLHLVRRLQQQTLATNAVRTPAHGNKSRTSTPSATPKAKAFDPLKKGGGPGGKKLCAHCNQPSTSTPVLRCSKCKVVYCSRECQRKAWPQHKSVCQAPNGEGARASGSMPPSAAPSAAASTASTPARDAATRPATRPALPPRSLNLSGAGPYNTAAAAASVSQPCHAAPVQENGAAGTQAETATAAQVCSSSGLRDGNGDSDGGATDTATAKGTEAAAFRSSAAAEAQETASRACAAAELDVGEPDGGDGPAPSLNDALLDYLQRATTNQSDEPEARLHRAIMLFVRGEYREALQQFGAVQAAARDGGDLAMEGEVWKWMAHCHMKLMDGASASQCFQQGVESARQQGNAKLQVECLSGFGMLCRARNETGQAVEHLQQALAVCASKDVDDNTRASVLCNLGAAIMPADQDAGLSYLEQAVALRENIIESVKESGDMSSLATALVEHASTLINLGAAQHVMKRLKQARANYERALGVFETMEDVDKVAKLLVNLSNMLELQMEADDESRAAAAGYRKQLSDFLAEHGDRCPSHECAICLGDLFFESISAPGREIIVLACCHTHHNACWETWCQQHSVEDIHCPVCRTPVAMFAQDGSGQLNSVTAPPADAPATTMADTVD